MTWQLGEMPDQTGRIVLVTGTSVGGLGHYTALELGRRGRPCSWPAATSPS